MWDTRKRITMGFNYQMATEIISCFKSYDLDDIIENINTLIYINAIDIDDFIRDLFNQNLTCIIKPMKNTILHTFIGKYLYFYLDNERYFLVDTLCDDFDIDSVLDFLDRYEYILDEYNCLITDYYDNIIKFDEEYEQTDGENRDDYKLYLSGIFESILNNINEHENEIVESIFYLLYGNKDFLFKFNYFISNYITYEYMDKNLFDNKNHLKRCSSIPTWLVRVIFYRDNGRCQHCGRDLSNINSITGNCEIQHDHVIPLEQGGTNDATNFQLLCSDCNQHKSGNIIKPNYLYQVYW